jgi:hypothetical protein
MADEEGNWQDRVAALKREKPAQWAILAAILALLAALLAWTFALLPFGAGIRGQPLFWLMALPAMVWMGAVQNYSSCAVRTVLPVLVGSPLLSLAALLTAPDLQSDVDMDQRLGTPLTMEVALGATLLLALAGGVALRRSSLPGGGRPACFLLPGSIPPETTISGEARGALAVGSLALSGTLINGVFFSIMTILPTEKDSAVFGAPWPAGIPAVLAVITMVLMVRGSARLRRATNGHRGT